MRNLVVLVFLGAIAWLGYNYLKYHPEVLKGVVDKVSAAAIAPAAKPKDDWKDAKPLSVTCETDVPAYDRAAPHYQVGTFKKGSEVVIEPIPWIDDMFPVRYQASDGTVVLAICKPYDLGFRDKFTIPADATPEQIEAIAKEEIKKLTGMP